MNRIGPHARWYLLAASCISAWGLHQHPVAANEPRVLANDRVSGEFDASGLVSLTEVASGQSLRLDGDAAQLTVDGEQLTVPGLTLVDTQQNEHDVTYSYQAGSADGAGSLRVETRLALR